LAWSVPTLRECAQVCDVCLTSRLLIHQIRLALLAAGYLWLFALLLSQLGIDTSIDENALQPSQVPEAVFICPTHADFPIG